LEVEGQGHNFDLEKVILKKKSIIKKLNPIKFPVIQHLNYINIFKNKKVVAILLFDVGLEVKNFKGQYLRPQRSWQQKILVVVVSH
jgi:hypothetical protein